MGTQVPNRPVSAWGRELLLTPLCGTGLIAVFGENAPRAVKMVVIIAE
jgi:hypothetical protein